MYIEWRREKEQYNGPQDYYYMTSEKKLGHKKNPNKGEAASPKKIAINYWLTAWISMGKPGAFAITSFGLITQRKCTLRGSTDLQRDYGTLSIDHRIHTRTTRAPGGNLARKGKKS